MPENLPENNRQLVIVSDTAFYREKDGELAVFEATLREIEILTRVFNRIVWLGFLYPEQNPGNARVPATSKIELVPLPFAGGHHLSDKVKIVKNLSVYAGAINRHLEGFEYVHTRGPAVPALITILKSFNDKDRKYWHKFAGNWNQVNPPKSYGLQRWLLKKAKNTFVSVNGTWKDQPPQVHFFENPCFTEKELEEARQQKKEKNYFDPDGLTICFVGRIEEAKGVGRLLSALEMIGGGIKKVYFVGGGPDLEKYRERAHNIDMDIVFSGKISRSGLNKIYAECQVFTLPSSASEGFPKVISESASYGCVPVVSSVSSIGQYIKTGETGILLEDLDPKAIASALDSLIKDRELLKKLADNFDKSLHIFTYEYYNERILNEFVKG